MFLVLSFISKKKRTISLVLISYGNYKFLLLKENVDYNENSAHVSF